MAQARGCFLSSPRNGVQREGISQRGTRRAPSSPVGRLWHAGRSQGGQQRQRGRDPLSFLMRHPLAERPASERIIPESDGRLGRLGEALGPLAALHAVPVGRRICVRLYKGHQQVRVVALRRVHPSGHGVAGQPPKTSRRLAPTSPRKTESSFLSMGRPPFSASSIKFMIEA